MALKSYVWHGPPTTLDIWPAEIAEGVAPLFSGHLVAGGVIPTPLPDDLFQVQSLVAFKLLVETAPQPIAVPAEASEEPSPRRTPKTSKQEPTDG
ncbi:hypothetical protein [Phreatobacter stygius]|uniref:Uncharacterized protein n=1 Tax=Phreatobacter stygius TaxID=1940610 RepID=A0A4D7AZ83_9HYPH|nr:hypothetical protein [Phreatobacter stygius]QCI65631.1 hypothetical protein E8M01_16305 [Phreatobacter stygius]